VSDQLLWLFSFFVLYSVFCIAWGVRCSRMNSTAADYFIANRQMSPWIFVLGVTAVSFSAWIFLGHPGLIYRDGFAYGYVALCAITIPLAGTLFFKRQWMLARRYGYLTPGEMFADYFQGQVMRWLVALVALAFAVPFAGIQLKASGFLVSLLSGSSVDADLATWVLAIPLVIYVSLGGIRGVAFVATLQALLLAAGILALGVIAYLYVGGLDSLLRALDDFVAGDMTPWAPTGMGDNPYVAVPGVIQFTSGLGNEIPQGGIWTGLMIMTTLLSFMGILASPTMSTWAFSSRTPRAFGAQQVWVSGALLGALLIFFGTPQGIAPHFLGATAAATNAGVTVADLLPNMTASDHAHVVPALIGLVGDAAPWLVGLLGVCGIAALQSTVAAHVNGAAGIWTRDIYLQHLRPDADFTSQVRMARIAAGLMMLAALLLATYTVDALVVLGGIALAMGFQLVPALTAICWLPWLTRQGVTVGLAFGLIGVMMTENLGVAVTAFFGLDLPWGRWPWTIHSAAWGMFFNILVCVVVSALSQTGKAGEHRRRYHEFLTEQAGLRRDKRALRPVAWSAVLLWFFFAVGPGTVIGNRFFGTPGEGAEGWELGMPSIWVWQTIGWALGILVLWFLAYRMEMADGTYRGFEPLVDDLHESRATGQTSIRFTEPAWYWSFAAGVVLLVIAQWIFGG